MRKSLIERVIREGIVDTRKYRYVTSGSIGELIKRVPIDQVEYPDAWTVVYDLSKERILTL